MSNADAWILREETFGDYTVRPGEFLAVKVEFTNSCGGEFKTKR